MRPIDILSALGVCLAATPCPSALPPGATLAFRKSSEKLYDPVRKRDIPMLFFRPTNGTGPWPLVTLNHGAGMNAEGYEYLGKAFAARGYVVAGFDEYSVEGTQLDYMLDIAAVRDSMLQQTANHTSPFYGLLCDNIIGVGHSLGGGAQFVAADREVMKDCGKTYPCNNGGYTANFQGLIALSGGFNMTSDPDHPSPPNTPNPYDSVARLTIPALFVSGTEDCMVKAMTEDFPAYANMTRSKCRVFSNVTGADHCQWAGLKALELKTCNLIEKTIGCKPDITPDEQQQLALRYALPFADYIAKSDVASFAALVAAMKADGNAGQTIFTFEGCSSV